MQRAVETVFADRANNSGGINYQLFFEIEVNSGRIFTEPRSGEVNILPLFTEIERIIVLVYTQEVFFADATCNVLLKPFLQTVQIIQEVISTTFSEGNH